MDTDRRDGCRPAPSRLSQTTGARPEDSTTTAIGHTIQCAQSTWTLVLTDSVSSVGAPRRLVHGVHQDPDDIAQPDYVEDFAAPVGRSPRCPDGRPLTPGLPRPQLTHAQTPCPTSGSSVGWVVVMWKTGTAGAIRSKSSIGAVRSIGMCGLAPGATAR